MSAPTFNVIQEVDKATGDILAVYFQIRLGKAKTVKEVREGVAFANYDYLGRLLGVELLAPCSVTVLARLANDEPLKHKNRIKDFFKKSIPKSLAIPA